MKKALISQYQSALNMLISGIEKCTEELWNDENSGNPYWRIVYHALYYTHFYTAKNPEEFKFWKHHIANYHQLGETSFDGYPIVITRIYTKAELQDYAESIYYNLDNLVQHLNPKLNCEFDWLPMSELELHIYNIRHLQHHIGQLVDRLKNSGLTVSWL
ncbi:MAG: DinB family protein [Pelobium sp.]